MDASYNTPRAVTVYGLASSEDGKIRYVGQTILRLAERRRLWITNSRVESRLAPVFCWVRSLSESQLVIVVIEHNAPRDERERHWIAHYRSMGPDLLNLADGGAGTPGVMPSLQTRAKRAASVKESWKTETVRVRWEPTEEQLAKQRANIPRGDYHSRAWLGRTHTEETKHKMSDSAKVWRAKQRECKTNG